MRRLGTADGSTALGEPSTDGDADTEGGSTALGEPSTDGDFARPDDDSTRGGLTSRRHRSTSARRGSASSTGVTSRGHCGTASRSLRGGS
jgi:hypothetical protein